MLSNPWLIAYLYMVCVMFLYCFFIEDNAPTMSVFWGCVLMAIFWPVVITIWLLQKLRR